MRRFVLLWLTPVALLAALAVAPLASGARTLFVRDVLNTHLGLRAFLAQSIRAGELPLIDPLRAGGQGLVGNPNAVPLYPDNLLLLVASPLWQLNAHFWLHGLLAVAAMSWLARVWGLGRESAFAAGVCYGFSGYLLSQMNLYNDVAGVALAPALVAALLGAAEPEPSRRGRRLAALGGLWALELLGGDPVVAAIALTAALGFAWTERRALPWRGIALALLAGSLVAAPQYVEMLRLLPASFRGFWGNDPGALVKTTPDPRGLLDLVLPLFFGRPDRVVSWSNAYFGGAPPLYWSLAPGLIALAAAAAGARAPDRRSRAALAIGLIAIVLAFSRPWMGELLARLPGGGLFRFPVKFALGAALAGSLLAGRGVAALLAGETAAFRRALALLAGLELAFVVFFALPGNALEGAFRAVFAAGLDDTRLAALRPGWMGMALLQLAVVAVALLAHFALRRRAAVAAAALVVLHAGSQLALLGGLVPTDEAAPYARPPALLERLPAGDVLAHGGSVDMFVRGYPASALAPDPASWRLWRRAQAEALSFPGLLAGRRYELNLSPEGLDSFLVQAIALGMTNFDDPQRLRVLAATGVDLLLLPRALDLAALGAARLELRTESAEPLFVYRLAPTLADAQLLGEAVFAPHVQSGLEAVFGSDFDPRRLAVVAGEGARRAGPAGTAAVERFAAEEIALAVDSAAGGFVVVRRAWLPIWEVEVDGAPAAPRIANLTRLAVEVPPGPHRVRFFVSRTPFRLALLAALVGLAGLAALAFGSRGARTGPVEPAGPSEARC